MRKAAEHVEKIRNAVVELLDADVAAAAQIRKGSDKILAVADEIHKHPLPTRSQVENWLSSHIDETRQHMFDAAKAWRTAAVAHEHALEMYDVAAEADAKGLQVDTVGLREVADSLRAHASQLKLIERRYESDAIQPSIYACNEAIARINEKHTVIAARLNATADRLMQIAAYYDIAPADRPRIAWPTPR